MLIQNGAADWFQVHYLNAFRQVMKQYQPDLSAPKNNKSGCGIRDLTKLELIAGYQNISLSYLLLGEGEGIEREDDVL